MSRAVRGRWAAPLNGGCPKHSTWPSNPQYALYPSSAASFTITLTQQPASAGAPLLAIGVVLMHGTAGARLTEGNLKKVVVTKSKFKATPSQTLQADSLEAKADGQCYVILPCTFDQGPEGAFELSVTSDDPGFRLEELPGDVPLCQVERLPEQPDAGRRPRERRRRDRAAR